MKNTKHIACLAIIVLSVSATAGAPQDDRPFCKTVPESAEWLLSQLPPETTLVVARMPREGLTHLHHGLGTWIRNNVPVWGNDQLRKSVGEKVHGDDVGAMILERYWELSRSKLPAPERERIEFYEATLPQLAGKTPTSRTHSEILAELNAQIQAAWPKDAKFPPFALRADADTHFNWEPTDMTDDLKGNVSRFLSYHRSIPFYDGEWLRVGHPDVKDVGEPSNRSQQIPP